LNLTGKRSLLQATVDRLSGLVSPERICVLTQRELVAAVAQQLPQIPHDAILGEPCRRDTAPCIGLAAALLLRRDKDAVMLVAPADHEIPEEEPFHAVVHQATTLVDDDPRRLVTFGIPPTYPSERFGYIQRGEMIAEDKKVFRAVRFREKPTAEIAEQFIASGDYYWNSGIFVWRADTILEALQEFEPEMVQRLRVIADASETSAFSETIEREFAAIHGKSVDYAVMEQYDKIVVVEVPFPWEDVGNWRSLARTCGGDEHGNTVEGKHLGLRTRGCIVRGEDDHLIVTVGLEDLIVVQTPDATLVARKHDEASIREVVGLLQQQGWDEFL
jgi:mannose-1-phosphate guanylyltransferase